MKKLEQMIDRLTVARQLIADPAHWTRGQEAEDAEGYDVDPWNPAAARWCAVGAIMRSCALSDVKPRELLSCVEEYARLVTRPWPQKHALITLNDTGPTAEAHAAVLEVFDAALTALRELSDATATVGEPVEDLVLA